MDKIVLRGMEFYAYHGVLEEEEKLGQRFAVELEMAADLRRAGQTDNLRDTLNYVEVYDIVRQTAQRERYHLIETVAEKIAARVLECFPKVCSVRVKVTKTTPPIEGILAGVSVEIERGRER